jgi:hypothetical protein
MRDLDQSERVQAEKELDIYGYTKLTGMLSADEVQTAKDLVQRYHIERKSNAYSGVPDRDKSDKILYNLPNKNRWFIQLLLQRDVRQILMKNLNDPHYRFLPPDVPNYYLSYFNARSSGDELLLHIDSHIPVPGQRTWSMQVAFVLDKSDIDNGCTKVIPGSHRIDSFTDRELVKSEPILANPGDVVLWDSRIWHGTYPNTSARDRWSLIATLVMWWVKPAMDFTRSISQELYESLTPEEKALLGFCCIPPKDENHRINTKSGYEIFSKSRDELFL